MSSSKRSLRPGSKSSLPRLFEDDAERSDTETNLLDDRGASIGVAQFITIVAGRDRGRVVTLGGDDFWIGRAPECNLVLRDRGVSRRHLRISRRDERLWIADNDAKNGTFRNDQRIAGEIELRSGDVIGVGTDVRLLFSSEVGMTSLRAPPVPSAGYLATNQREDGGARIDSVIAGLAHQISTPLGVARTANDVISSLTELVARAERGDDLNEVFADLRASTGLVTKNLERAHALVRSLIQLSLDAPTEELVDGDLGVWLTDVIDGLEPELTQGRARVKATWSATDKFPWRGYPQACMTLVRHLLVNAATHAYPSGEGLVECGLEARGDRYAIQVTDWGVGLAPEVSARLFRPFTTTAHERGAAGLGLAIARHLAKNILRGAIECTSQLGRGTTFTITVPRVVRAVP